MDKLIAEGAKIDMVLCDLPYGAGHTAHKWDKHISLAELWRLYAELVRPDGVIALFAAEPFTSGLIQSNLADFRYKWVWVKNATGFLNSAYRPLKTFEEIAVFSKATVGSLSRNPIRYFPQGIVAANIKKRNNPNSTWRGGKGYKAGGNKLNSDAEFTQKYTNHPTDLLYFKPDKGKTHPTQKPIALCEYLIKTYTEEGETVLDNCMGSGSCGVAAANTGRGFVGIELDKGYFEIAKERIGKAIEDNRHKQFW
jgi:site-specific DNA-methyltransferase (adenine-specific)